MIATAMVKAPQNRLPDLGILLISIVGFFTKTFSPTCSIDTPAVCRDCGGWNSRAKNKKRVAWPPREPHPLIEQFASGHSSMETLVTQGDHWISLVSLGRAMLQSASNFSLGASAQWGNDGFCSTDGHGSNVSASATVKHRHLDAVMRWCGWRGSARQNRQMFKRCDATSAICKSAPGDGGFLSDPVMWTLLYSCFITPSKYNSL